MESIYIAECYQVKNGLEAMLRACHCQYLIQGYYVEVEIALLIVEIAKLADDREDWFPRGKWATIQSLQDKIEKELARAIKFKMEEAKCNSV